MSRLLGAAAALLLTVLFAPAGAPAHAGADPAVEVPLDHVEPGQSFPLIATDLGRDTPVELTISQGGSVVPLGTATSGPDGHFTATLVMPKAAPAGYVQLQATGADGSAAATWVLVGERTASTSPPPGQTSWWKDPAVLLFVLVLAGGLVALAVLGVRSARSRAAAGD
jgi:hypothetical protein